jgi:hypothetical protein
MKSNSRRNGLAFQRQAIAYEKLDPHALQDVATGDLGVVVPYTTPELTRAALSQAIVCSDLNVHISLVDVQVVPFPCPLDQPPIDNGYSHRRLQNLLKDTGLPAQAAVLYTRDWLEGFRKLLDPKSLVIVASKKRFWKTREEKLARALSKAGHHVMLLPV